MMTLIIGILLLLMLAFMSQEFHPLDSENSCNSQDTFVTAHFGNGAPVLNELNTCRNDSNSDEAGCIDFSQSKLEQGDTSHKKVQMSKLQMLEIKNMLLNIKPQNSYEQLFSAQPNNHVVVESQQNAQMKEVIQINQSLQLNCSEITFSSTEEVYQIHPDVLNKMEQQLTNSILTDLVQKSISLIIPNQPFEQIEEKQNIQSSLPVNSQSIQSFQHLDQIASAEDTDSQKTILIELDRENHDKSYSLNSSEDTQFEVNYDILWKNINIYLNENTFRKTRYRPQKTRYWLGEKIIYRKGILVGERRMKSMEELLISKFHQRSFAIHSNIIERKNNVISGTLTLINDGYVTLLRNHLHFQTLSLKTISPKTVLKQSLGKILIERGERKQDWIEWRWKKQTIMLIHNLSEKEATMIVKISL